LGKAAAKKQIPNKKLDNHNILDIFWVKAAAKKKQIQPKNPAKHP
jgi:hypothetical protein